MSRTILLLFFLAAFLQPGYQLYAQDNDECLACHIDPSLEMTKNGRTISLQFNHDKFNQFGHGKLKCVNCHTGFDPFEIPHKENIGQVNCMKCHTDPASIHKFHPGMKNAQALMSRPDVTCKNCHNYHFPESAQAIRGDMSNMCNKCHGKETQMFKASVHSTAAGMNCLSCHDKPVTSGFGLKKDELNQNKINLCLNCHSQDRVTGQSEKEHLINLTSSIHGNAILSQMREAPVCTDCHGIHNVQSGDLPTSSMSANNIMKTCSQCHINIVSEFQSSVHGLALSQNIEEAPSCKYCHGEHKFNKLPGTLSTGILQDTATRANYEQNLMIYCVSCHEDEALSAKFGLQTINEAHNWLTRRDEHLKAVRCVDCHSSRIHNTIAHDILPTDKAIKDCDHCHSTDSRLISLRALQQKKEAVEEKGNFIGVLSADAYVKSISRNLLVETISWLIFGLIVAGLIIHAVIRIYFRSVSKKRDK